MSPILILFLLTEWRQPGWCSTKKPAPPPTPFHLSLEKDTPLFSNPNKLSSQPKTFVNVFIAIVSAGVLVYSTPSGKLAGSSAPSCSSPSLS
ncbi:hypothetical protein ACFX1T_046925 [Malus domestica]